MRTMKTSQLQWHKNVLQSVEMKFFLSRLLSHLLYYSDLFSPSICNIFVCFLEVSSGACYDTSKSVWISAVTRKKGNTRFQLETAKFLARYYWNEQIYPLTKTAQNAYTTLHSVVASIDEHFYWLNGESKQP